MPDEDCPCTMEKISELSGEEDDSNMLNRSEKFQTMEEALPTVVNSAGKVSMSHFVNETED